MGIRFFFFTVAISLLTTKPTQTMEKLFTAQSSVFFMMGFSIGILVAGTVYVKRYLDLKKKLRNLSVEMNDLLVLANKYLRLIKLGLYREDILTHSFEILGTPSQRKQLKVIDTTRNQILQELKAEILSKSEISNICKPQP